jgi:nitrite reductase/ring-hydroxylating ferredoxin subunit
MGLLGKKKKPEWVRVASVEDFAHSHEVKVGKREYALYKVEDGIYCTQNSCSHEYSPLSEGIIMGDEVFCEKHGSRFNIKSGKVVNLPATEDIKTFEVKVEGSDIFIFVSPG